MAEIRLQCGQVFVSVTNVVFIPSRPTRWKRMTRFALTRTHPVS
jgi:hypothetical protein